MINRAPLTAVMHAVVPHVFVFGQKIASFNVCFFWWSMSSVMMQILAFINPLKQIPTLANHACMWRTRECGNVCVYHMQLQNVLHVSPWRLEHQPSRQSCSEATPQHHKNLFDNGN